MVEARRDGAASWAAAAALVIASAAAISVLSRSFVYGQGHAQRPIIAFLAWYGAGWLGFAMAAVLAWRGAKANLWLIMGVGLAARAVLLPSSLIQENDGYRYVLDGEAVLHGVNPYRYAPDEAAYKAPEPFADELAKPEAALVLSRISYPHVPTIYPPLAQAAFALGAWLTPWDWRGQRLVFLACDVATLLLLAWMLRRSGKPAAWLALHAWNPLLLKEIANSAHSDSLAALCIVTLVAALLGLQCRPSSNVLPLLAGLMFAGAVLARLYPILLGPVCVAWLAMGERPGKRLALFVTAAAAAVSLAYWPFLGAGLGRLTEGLRTYGAHWLRNAGAFLLLGKLPGDPRRTVAVATVLYAVAEGVVLFWRSRKAGDRPAHDPAALVGALQRVLLCWLLLTPAVFPWYTVALIALLALRPTFWGVVMSGALGAYYLLFLYDYRDYPSEDAWKLWTQGLEHGLIWVAVVVGTVYGAMKARRERCVDA